MLNQPLTIHVVPHTHWDREWYLPFQRFRMRLVEVVDAVLELLETNRDYRFTLDGQLAAIDDYLEIRPDGAARIRSLVAQGRLAIGPWQILMDEFLVSGETIVRNLETGLARADELGGAMEVGYLPDMFGHVAQMPQLLRRAGIDHAVVARGVPAAIDRHAFHWHAPDGSTVRAEYLVGSYGNAAHLADDHDRIELELERFVEAADSFFDSESRLAMVGTDHMPPNPELPALLERVNRDQTRFRLRLTTLGDYLEQSAGTSLPVWHGELRSAARNNMLMGVNSARLDLKAACARAERLLVRGAEPLAALQDGDWPEAFLREAWERVIANSAHDSICGCSADEVCDQVLVRFAEAEQIAAGLVERAAAAAAALVPLGSIAVYNPSPLPRVDTVEINVSVPDAQGEISLELPDGARCRTQEVGRTGGVLHSAELPGSRLPSFLDRIHGRELFGGQINRFEIDVPGGGVLFEIGEAPEGPFDAWALEQALRAAAAAAPETVFRIRILGEPRRRLLAAVPAPPLGWTSLRAVEGPAALASPVRAGERSLSNGLLEVTVADDGTIAVSGEGFALAGVGRLVDGGDAGDSYNYAPPAEETLVEAPVAVAVEVRAAGPVAGKLETVRTLRWPVGLAAAASARSAETVEVTVTTTVELRSGEPFLRLGVAFDNRCSDHRLRFHVPLARTAESSFAEGQFAVVERRGPPEGGYGEVPLATYPAHGFVDAGGVALLLEHPSEYELVDGRELALTILRSTGLISRSDNAYREDPAGPQLPIPAAQCQGPWRAAFGIYPHAGTWEEADTTAVLERYLHPFVTAPGSGRAGAAPAPRAGLRLSGRGVVLSSLRRRGDGLELRLVCERGRRATALVAGPFAAARDVDLRGRPGRQLALDGDGLRLELAPWEIRTVLLGG